MDRRTALATAGAIVIVTLTGGAAVAANMGLLADTPAQPAGQLQPADPELTEILVEPAPAEDTTAAVPVAAPQGDDDEYEGEDEHEDDGDYEGEHEDDEEHEYEGADDDD